MAIENLITDHLDLWTAAVRPKSSAGRGSNSKLELTGIKKLRELILELAVRGKLVPQDPSDEPTSVLLERIAVEKARLVKEKKIKQEKPLPGITEEEKLYGVPDSWCFCRLGDICHGITSGSTPPKDKFSESDGVPYLKVYNIRNQQIDFDYQPQFIEKDYNESKLKRSMLYPGDVVMNIVGPPLGKVAIIPDTYPVWNCNQAIVFFRPIDSRINTYIYTYLVTGLFLRSIELIGTAGQDNISVTKSRLVVLPVPPLAEQYRIVAKVDELMALCDQLEQQSEAQLAAHQTLVEALLATLTDSTDADELAQNWTRLSTHFDTIFTTEASIDALKQTILQLAVMGKLVPQDPSDEPASALLERIAAEKALLVKEKKIKKEKPQPVINEDEKPFELPQGWVWCRLNDLALSSEAGWSPQCEPTSREYNKWGVLKVSAVTWGIFKPEENKELPESLEPRPEYEVKPGDFLISRANTAELVARAVIVPNDAPIHLMMSDKIIRFKFSKLVEPHFVNMVNNSVFSRIYYAKVAGGTSSSMKNVSRSQIQNLVVALPPRSEELKIIDKVNGLMTICDRLQSRLQSSQQTQLKLTETIIENSMR